MKEILKKMWMFFMRVRLKKKKVFIDKDAHFNKETSFAGYNKVSKGAWLSSAKIGRYTYIGAESYLWNTEIGSFCSIASNVRVEPVTHPTIGFISTSPVFFSLIKQCGRSFVKKQLFNEQRLIDNRTCIIGNDVWIGNNVQIVGGVQIGNGAIVAMGAVVTKNVPPYAIVAGVPARVIRYRFTEEEIEELQSFRWWDKSDKWLEQHTDLFSNTERFFEFLKKER